MTRDDKAAAGHKLAEVVKQYELAYMPGHFGLIRDMADAILADKHETPVMSAAGRKLAEATKRYHETAGPEQKRKQEWYELLRLANAILADAPTPETPCDDGLVEKMAEQIASLSIKATDGRKLAEAVKQYELAYMPGHFGLIRDMADDILADKQETPAMTAADVAGPLCGTTAPERNQAPPKIEYRDAWPAGSAAMAQVVACREQLINIHNQLTDEAVNASNRDGERLAQLREIRDILNRD